MKPPRTVLVPLAACLLMVGARSASRLQESALDIQKARELYAKAKEAHKSEDFDKVLALCREAVRLHPTYVEAHREIIDHDRDRAKLEQMYREQLEKDPDNPVFHYLLGRVLQAPSEKEARYREAIRLNPDFPWGHLGLGAVLTRKGLGDEGIAHYRKVIELDPGNMYGYRGTAQACNRMGKSEEARQAYRRMIEAFPDEPSGYTGLASVLKSKLDAPEQAAAVYRQAYERFQEDSHNGPRMLLQLALLTPDTSEKMEMLHRLVERYPQSSSFGSAYTLILANYKTSDPDRAVRMARQTLQMPSSPDDKRLKARAYETLLDIYRQQQRQVLEKALAAELLDSGFVHPGLYGRLGRRYADSGKAPEMALQFLEKAHTQAKAENLLGTVVFGRPSDEMLERTARRMRDDFRLQMGKLHLGQGRLESALEDLTAASASEHPAIKAVSVYQMGLAYEQSGRLEESVRVLIEAVVLHKDDEAKADLTRVYQQKRGSLEGLASSLVDFATALASQNEGAIEVAAEEPSLDEAVLRARTLVSGQAPDFSVKILGGTQVALSELRSKAVVINFWATWCGPCLVEFPYFQEAYERYQDRGDVQFLAISTEGPEALPAVQKLIEKKGYTFPVALSSETAKAYGATAIPTLVVVGASGRIQYREVGFDMKAKQDFVQKLSDKIEFTLGGNKPK